MAEKGEKVGGAAAYSGGQVWVGANHVAQRYGLLDSIEDTLKYVQAAAGRDAPSVDEALCERWLQGAGDAAQWLEQMGVIQWELIPDYPDYYYPTLPGSRAAGRYLTGALFDGQLLGKVLASLHVSPHFPVGITYSEMFKWGGTSSKSRWDWDLVARRRSQDILTFGTCIAAALFKGVLDRAVDLRLQHSAVALLSPNGPALAALVLPGYRLADPSFEGDSGYRACFEHCLPHCFLVNRQGHRFCDDSLHSTIVSEALKRDVDGMPHNLSIFMNWDSNHHAKYGLGRTMPGCAYPPGLVSSASTLEGKTLALGINAVGLEASAARFNAMPKDGVDTDFGRGSNPSVRRFRGDWHMPLNPNMGPVDKGPFHGMRLRLLNTGMGGGGVCADLHGQQRLQLEPGHGVWLARRAACKRPGLGISLMNSQHKNLLIRLQLIQKYPQASCLRRGSETPSSKRLISPAHPTPSILVPGLRAGWLPSSRSN